MTASTILLVEDDPDDIELTRMALQENRIANEVVVVQSGDAALEYLFGDDNGSEPGTPAIVLLDLKLPRLNGVEVLRRIRACERTRLTPVIILTSSDEQRDVIESYSLGANSYVRKPIDYADFVEAVRQLGIYWLLLNLAPGSSALAVSS